MTTSHPMTCYTYGDEGHQVTIEAWDVSTRTVSDPSVAISVTNDGTTVRLTATAYAARRLARALREAADVAEGDA